MTINGKYTIWTAGKVLNIYWSRDKEIKIPKAGNNIKWFPEFFKKFNLFSNRECPFLQGTNYSSNSKIISGYLKKQTKTHQGAQASR